MAPERELGPERERELEPEWELEPELELELELEPRLELKRQLTREERAVIIKSFAEAVETLMELHFPGYYDMSWTPRQVVQAVLDGDESDPQKGSD